MTYGQYSHLVNFRFSRSEAMLRKSKQFFDGGLYFFRINWHRLWDPPLCRLGISSVLRRRSTIARLVAHRPGYFVIHQAGNHYSTYFIVVQ